MARNIDHFTISNPAISFLLHDCVKSIHNHYGLLFGEIHKKISNVTSDSQVENENIETTISITASWPIQEDLFNEELNLKNELLENILSDSKHEIVGWYTFSRNLDFSPSLKQHLLNRHLCKYFSHIPNEYFVFLRINTMVEPRDNYTFTNKFYCTTGFDMSHPVELNIRQLGEFAHEYSTQKQVTQHSETYDSILNSINVDNQDSIQSFEHLQSCMSNKLLEQIHHDNADQIRLDSIKQHKQIPDMLESFNEQQEDTQRSTQSQQEQGKISNQSTSTASKRNISTDNNITNKTTNSSKITQRPQLRSMQQIKSQSGVQSKIRTGNSPSRTSSRVSTFRKSPTPSGKSSSPPIRNASPSNLNRTSPRNNINSSTPPSSQSTNMNVKTTKNQLKVNQNTKKNSNFTPKKPAVSNIILPKNNSYTIDNNSQPSSNDTESQHGNDVDLDKSRDTYSSQEY